MTKFDVRTAVVLSAIVTVAIVGGLWESRAPSAAATPTVATAEAIYSRDCAVCHGATGRGTPLGPTLAGVGRAAVHYYVSTGRMPLATPARTEERGRTKQVAPARFAPEPGLHVARHASPYTPPEMAALIDYTAALTGGGPDVAGLRLAGADLGSGGELFRLQCAACHSWAGEGGALLHREAPDVLRATSRQAAEAIRIGPGAMPAFGTAALNDHQLEDLVAYVKVLQHASDPGGGPLWHLGPVAEGAIAWVVGLGALVLFIRWIGERG